jgi:hypothetical protein
MTKTVRNSLFALFTAILACSVILFSATFANAKAESYDGLTGTKDKSEVTSVVELDSFVVDEDVKKYCSPCIFAQFLRVITVNLFVDLMSISPVDFSLSRAVKICDSLRQSSSASFLRLVISSPAL